LVTLLTLLKRGLSTELLLGLKKAAQPLPLLARRLEPPALFIALDKRLTELARSIRRLRGAE
jgi:hypothetical protein